VTVEFGPERDLLVRVLQSWVRRRGSSHEKELSSRLQALKIVNPDWGLTHLWKADLPVELGGRTDGFLVGPPVEERGASFQPVASVRAAASNGQLQVCIRLATYYLDRRGSIAADGWRFESGETATNAPHPWSHAQRCTRWYKEDATLLDPLLRTVELDSATADGCPHIVNEIRPAIPLACSTAAGLALTMIGSLHGRPFIQDIVDSDARLKHSLCPADRHALLLLV
jgi:hypothetical protein